MATNSITLLRTLGSTTLGSVVRQFGCLMRTWHRRAADRRYLSQMSESMLRDIGIGPGELEREVRKPFWRT